MMHGQWAPSSPFNRLLNKQLTGNTKTIHEKPVEEKIECFQRGEGSFHSFMPRTWQALPSLTVLHGRHQVCVFSLRIMANMYVGHGRTRALICQPHRP
jgi:hypothetical protein